MMFWLKRDAKQLRLAVADNVGCNTKEAPKRRFRNQTHQCINQTTARRNDPFRERRHLRLHCI